MADSSKIREIKRQGRHQRLRKRVQGKADRPRLCIHRSHKNLYAQVIDDLSGKVLIGVSTLNKGVRQKVKYGGNKEAAAILGESMASQAQGKGIKQVSFDRGGYLFHGRVKAFVEGARKGGLEF